MSGEPVKPSHHVGPRRGPKQTFPEIRPGVKVCNLPECDLEFHLDPDASPSVKAGWKYRGYCTRTHQNVNKSREERARIKAAGLPRCHYRRKGKERPKPKPRPDRDRPATREIFGRGVTPLNALPPEAKAPNVKVAMFRAIKQHEEFGPLLERVYREQRGFKSRVRREIAESRRGANA
jgi:hypothetical protein